MKQLTYEQMQPIRDFLEQENLKYTIIKLGKDKYNIKLDRILTTDYLIETGSIKYELYTGTRSIVSRNLINKLNYYLNIVDKLNELMEVE